MKKNRGKYPQLALRSPDVRIVVNREQTAVAIRNSPDAFIAAGLLFLGAGLIGYALSR